MHSKVTCLSISGANVTYLGPDHIPDFLVRPLNRLSPRVDTCTLSSGLPEFFFLTNSEVMELLEWKNPSPSIGPSLSENLPPSLWVAGHGDYSIHLS